MKEQKKTGNSGITLIALVVTIIVLLLLAGISIQMLSGNNGILQRAGEAKEETEKESIREQAEMIKMNIFLENRDNFHRAKLLGNIKQNFKGSLIEGNKVVTANKKWDIIVDDKNNISVEKHKEMLKWIKLEYSVDSSPLGIVLTVYPTIINNDDTFKFMTYEEYENSINTENDLKSIILKMYNSSPELKKDFIEAGYIEENEEIEWEDMQKFADIAGIEYEGELSVTDLLGVTSDVSIDQIKQLFISEGIIKECYNIDYSSKIVIKVNDEVKTINLAEKTYATFVIEETGDYYIEAKNANGIEGIEFAKIDNLPEIKDNNTIIYIDNKYILRKSGQLSRYELINTNGEEKEFETNQINEIVIATNVKNIYKDYFLTEDGKLYCESLENLCLENIKKIELIDNSSYWLVNGESIYYEGDFHSPPIATGEIIAAKRYINDETTRHGLRYVTKDDRLWECGQSNVKYENVDGNIENFNTEQNFELTADNILFELKYGGYWVDENNNLYIKRYTSYNDYLRTHSYTIQKLGKISAIYSNTQSIMDWERGDRIYGYINTETNILKVGYEYGKASSMKFFDSFDLNNEIFRGKNIKNLYLMCKRASGSHEIYAGKGAIELENGEIYLSDGTLIDINEYEANNSINVTFKLNKIENPIRENANATLNIKKMEVKNSLLNIWPSLESRLEYHVKNFGNEGEIYYKNGKWMIKTHQSDYSGGTTV